MLEQMGKRSVSIPLHRKLKWNGVRVVLHRCEASLGGKYRIMGGNPFDRFSGSLKRESMPRAFELSLGSHKRTLIWYGIAGDMLDI
jgi:hypothetical protein